LFALAAADIPELALMDGLPLMGRMALADGLVVTDGFALIAGLALVVAWRVAAPAGLVAAGLPLPPVRLSVTPAVVPATTTSAARTGSHPRRRSRRGTGQRTASGTPGSGL
jgi:hypothetical protein